MDYKSRACRAELAAAISLHAEQHGLSPRQLATTCRVDETQVSRLLTGVTKAPHPGTLKALLEGLKLNPKELLAQYDTAGRPASVVRAEAQGRPPAAAFLKVCDQISQVIDHLLHGVVSQEVNGRLTPLVSAVRMVLNAEAVALFLLPADMPERMLLRASESDRLQRDVQVDRVFEIHEKSRGGLTGYVVNKWRKEKPAPIGYKFAELENNEFVAKTYQDHLVGGTGYSTAFIPLLDRHGRLVGLITVANKKGPDGQAGKEHFFSDEDKQIGVMLAAKIVQVLEMSSCLQIFHTALIRLQEGAKLEDLPWHLLRAILDVFRASTGQLALWDSQQRDLVFKAMIGARGRPEERQGPVPPGHPVREVWKSPYEPITPSPRAITLPLFCNGRILGVLHLEAPAFQPKDHETLGILGKWIAIVLQAAVSEARHALLLRQVLEEKNDLGTILQHVLEAMHVIYGITGSAIYMKEGEETLRCAAYFDHLPMRDLPIKRLERLEHLKPEEQENSAALHVLHKIGEKPRPGYFSANPELENNPPQAELKQFHIQGSLLALPLNFHAQTVGVLVAWNDKPASDSGGPARRGCLQPGHLFRLQGLATLAAMKIAEVVADPLLVPPPPIKKISPGRHSRPQIQTVRPA
jgi:GAF domain-containing protein/predicted XRE-type DNA-binding protein